MSKIFWPLLFVFFFPNATFAAPRAAIVVDASTDEILYSENIDARLHPASLTQLMTLLLAFEAIDSGRSTLNDQILISPEAAQQPRPSLGLRTGQRIQLRYLLAASAAGKRFDAATAIAEGVAGDEMHFVDQMNSRANELCMLNSRFDNPRGHRNDLAKHVSTAHDLAILGTQIFQTNPDVFALTIRERISSDDLDMLGTHARRAEEIGGVNGMMTGYRLHAGFVALVSIHRAGRDLIVVVLGERSTTEAQDRIERIVSEAIEAEKAPLGFLDHCQFS